MRHYFKYRRVIDAAICTAIVYFVLFMPSRPSVFIYPSDAVRQNLGFCLIGTSSSLLGFVLAASTFLISHIQQPKFDILRAARSYKQLPELFSSSLWRLFVATIAGGVLAFASPDYLSLAVPFVTFVTAWTLIALAATLWVVLKIYSVPLRA